MQVFATIPEALDRAYDYVLVATKALPEVLPTSSLLSPLLSRPYAIDHPQPTYILMQNGLGVERDLYDSAKKLYAEQKHGDKDVKIPRILSTVLWIGTNMVADNVVQHNDFVRISWIISRLECQLTVFRIGSPWDFTRKYLVHHKVRSKWKRYRT